MSKKPGIEVNLNTFISVWIPAYPSRDSEINMKHLSQAVGVSNRKKFRIIEKYSTLEWARENPNVDDIKDIQISNGSSSGITDEQWSRLILSRINVVKQEFVVQRATSAKIASDAARSAATTNPPAKQNLDPKSLTKKGENSLTNMGNILNSNLAINQYKRKVKLREQLPTGFSVDKGDEPEDGPDLYLILKGFKTEGIITHLIQRAKLKVDTIMVIRDFPSYYDDNGVQRSEFALNAAIPENPAIQKLKKQKWTADAASLWQNVCWCDISGIDVSHHLALLDKICKSIYELLEFKKVHQKLTTSNVVQLPKLAPINEVDVSQFYSSDSKTCLNDVQLYYAQLLDKVCTEAARGASADTALRRGSGRRGSTVTSSEIINSQQQQNNDISNVPPLPKAKKNDNLITISIYDHSKKIRYLSPETSSIRPNYTLIQTLLSLFAQPGNNIRSDENLNKNCEQSQQLNGNKTSQNVITTKEEILTKTSARTFLQMANKKFGLKFQSKHYRWISSLNPDAFAQAFYFLKGKYKHISVYQSENEKEAEENQKQTSSNKLDGYQLIAFHGPRINFEKHAVSNQDIYVKTNTNLGPLHDLKLFIESQKEEELSSVYKNFDSASKELVYDMGKVEELMQDTVETQYVYCSDGSHVEIERHMNIHGEVKKCDKKIKFHHDFVVASTHKQQLSSGVNQDEHQIVVNISCVDSTLIQVKRKKDRTIDEILVSSGDGKWYKFTKGGEVWIRSFSKKEAHLVRPDGTLLKQKLADLVAYHPEGKMTQIASNKISHVNEKGQVYILNAEAKPEYVKTYRNTFYTDIKAKSKRQIREDGVRINRTEDGASTTQFHRLSLSSNRTKQVSIEGLDHFSYTKTSLFAQLGNGIRLNLSKMNNLSEFKVDHPLYSFEWEQGEHCVLTSTITKAQVKYTINLDEDTIQIKDFHDEHIVSSLGDIETKICELAISETPTFTKLMTHPLDQFLYNPSALMILFPDGSGIHFFQDLDIKQRYLLFNTNPNISRIVCDSKDCGLLLTMLKKRDKTVLYDQYFGIDDISSPFNKTTLAMLNESQKYAEMALEETFNKPVEYRVHDDESKNIFSSFTVGRYISDNFEGKRSEIGKMKWMEFINEPIPFYFDSPEGKASFKKTSPIPSAKKNNSTKKGTKGGKIEFRYIMSPDDQLDLPKNSVIDTMNQIDVPMIQKNTKATLQEMTHGPVWQRLQQNQQQHHHQKLFGLPSMRKLNLQIEPKSLNFNLNAGSSSGSNGHTGIDHHHHTLKTELMIKNIGAESLQANVFGPSYIKLTMDKHHLCPGLVIHVQVQVELDKLDKLCLVGTVQDSIRIVTEKCQWEVPLQVKFDSEGGHLKIQESGDDYRDLSGVRSIEETTTTIE